MDGLNAIIGGHKRFWVDIPGADQAKLTTVDTLVTHIAQRIR